MLKFLFEASHIKKELSESEDVPFVAVRGLVHSSFFDCWLSTKLNYLQRKKKQKRK